MSLFKNYFTYIKQFNSERYLCFGRKYLTLEEIKQINSREFGYSSQMPNQEAIPQLEKYIEEHPEDIAELRLLSFLYWEEDEQEKATLISKRILQLNPDDERAEKSIEFGMQCNQITVCINNKDKVEQLMKEKKYKEVISIYEPILKQYYPNIWFFHYDLAESYFQIEHWDKVLKIDNLILEGCIYSKKMCLFGSEEYKDNVKKIERIKERLKVSEEKVNLVP